MKIREKIIIFFAMMILFAGFALALPDPVIQDVTPKPAYFCDNEPIVLNFSVYNQGNAAANNLEIGIYVDNTRVLTMTGRTVNAYQKINRVAVIEKPAGSHEVKIVPDPMNKISKELNYYRNYSLFYASRSCGSFNGAALKRCFSSSKNDHIYTTGSCPTGYSAVGTEGQVSTDSYPAIPSGMLQLYGLYSPANDMHDYTSSGSEVSASVDIGHGYGGIVGFIYPYSATGRTALYHLYSSSRSDNILTINSSEYQKLKNEGWSDYGIEGYVVGTDPGIVQPKPDLTVNDISISNDIGKIDTTAYCEVKNIGASTSQTFNVNLYIDNIYSGTTQITGISQNQIKTASFANKVFQPGTRNIRCSASASFSEESTFNNERTESFIFQTPPAPAPRPAFISNVTPLPGQNISYVLHYEAYPLDKAYKTFVHFKADDNTIIRNDDHYPDFAYPYIPTNSSSFHGTDFSYYGRTRTVTIPSNFSGHLRMVTGFYEEISPGANVPMRTDYATDIGNNQYLIGEVDVTSAEQLLPAPMPFDLSNSSPKGGETISYNYKIEAHQMNKSYRTFIHFIDDSGNIIINDDHWIQNITGFATDSSSFDGTISYSRDVKIPSQFNGILSLVTGFYEYDNYTLGDRMNLSDKYVQDINYNRYKVGEIDVQPYSEFRIALSRGDEDPRIDDLIPVFPELFVYDSQKNKNLAQAILLISDSFRSRGVEVNKELLTVIITTLRKEVGGSFLPIEEGGDFGMGSGCAYTVDGRCRGSPYSGGLDYKGRGYIMITHDYNYRTHCGEDCMNPKSSPENDICRCKNQWNCLETNVNICPQRKAMIPEKAAEIFASYYLSRDLVTKANKQDYYGVGAGINTFKYSDGTTYPGRFNYLANQYMELFENNQDKVNSLLSLIVGENPYKEGERVKEVGDNKVYIVENGKFRHIVDETSFCVNIYGDLKELKNFIEIPSGEISRLNMQGEDITAPQQLYDSPLPPEEGALVKDVCSSEIYLYEGGKYRWIINETTFNKLGYKFSDVIDYAYNRIAQEESYGIPIKYEPSCSLPSRHKSDFIDVDDKDLNYEDVNLMRDLIFSYPLEQDAPYNPSSNGDCGDFKICNHYRGDYHHSREGLGSHAGIDILAPAFTTKVYAIADGIIVGDSDNNRLVLSAYGEDAYRTKEKYPTFYCYNGFCPGFNGGYGGMVIIKHPDILLKGKPIYSVYMHLRHFNPDLQIGTEVNAGTFLGTLAEDMYSSDNRASGSSTDPHLHFQISTEYDNSCIDPQKEYCAWPYEPRDTYRDDSDGFLNTVTVNPLKLLNSFGYYMPQELGSYYECYESVDATGLSSQEIRNIDILYPYDNNIRMEWAETPSATYEIALSKTDDFAVSEIIGSSTPSIDLEVDDSPTYAKIKSFSTAWSAPVLLYNNQSKICSKLDRYIADYEGCGLSIYNSEINSNPLDSVTIRNSNITDSQIHGDYTIEDASIINNTMTSGSIYWGTSHFTGKVALSKVISDCINTTDIEVKGPSDFRICPGRYQDILKISTSNFAIDLKDVNLAGGIIASSGYTMDNATEDIQGINGSSTREDIDAKLEGKPSLENITIMNGNFADCDVGINMSLVDNALIENNNFSNCRNGIILAGTGLEITGNRVELDSSSDGYGLAVGGVDNLVTSNIVVGDYETGIGVLGWNISSSSNEISNSRNGMSMIGFHLNASRNRILNSTKGIGGIFISRTTIKDNSIGADKGIYLSCISNSTINDNQIDSEYEIELKKFFNNKCSVGNDIIGNNIEKAIIMGKTVYNGETYYGNVVGEQTAEDESYSFVYVPKDPKGAENVEFGISIDGNWTELQMQYNGNNHSITFENLSSGEQYINVKYTVPDVDFSYYAGSAQGTAGDLYLNGELLGCDYLYYYGSSTAGFKLVADGEGGFSNPGSEGRLLGCEQLCSEERLNKRVGWDGESLFIPDSVFTGNCYANGTLQFDCPAVGKNIALSGAFDSWQRTVAFNAQAQICGLTDSTMKIKWDNAPLTAKETGFSVVYNENNIDHWLDVNPCHPDVILVDQAHQVMPNDMVSNSSVCG